MKKPLSHFRHMDRQIIAQLDGMKSIMRVETIRTTQWWLVLPSVGDQDSVCVRIHKMSACYDPTCCEKTILKQYADRVTA